MKHHHRLLFAMSCMLTLSKLDIAQTTKKYLPIIDVHVSKASPTTAHPNY